PTASDIYDELLKWHNIVVNWSSAFRSADMIIPALSTKPQIYPKDRLT
ncbi:14191_t:CDS:1, partial [Racocetra persica]